MCSKASLDVRKWSKTINSVLSTVNDIPTRRSGTTVPVRKVLSSTIVLGYNQHNLRYLIYMWYVRPPEIAKVNILLGTVRPQAFFFLFRASHHSSVGRQIRKRKKKKKRVEKFQAARAFFLFRMDYFIIYQYVMYWII